MAALVGGSFIFLAVTIVFLVGVILTLFTRRGSGMNHHPYRHVHGGAPGAAIPSEDFSGSDRTSSIERAVARHWRQQDRPAPPPAAERAATREREQRPKPSNGLPIGPPL
jgi:hypothetical protein